MQTVHNEIWSEVLVQQAIKHFDAIYAGGMTVDDGENCPPDMVFEPWMRTEIGCWGEVVNGVRVAFLRFRAGTEAEPFQETLVTITGSSRPGQPVEAVIAHTVPNDEFRLCEVVSNMIHLIAHQVASIAGRPGCCCGNEPDGAEHIHPEFIVPDVVIVEGSNIEVLKPSNIGRGLTNPFGYVVQENFKDGVLHDVTPVANNVTPLRAVKHDAPGDQ